MISDSDSFVFSIILELYWAEECFKRAISHYADFLWRMKKDLWSAEEMYLQALSIEPNSTGHAFLLMLLGDNNNKIFYLNRDECIKRACDL